MEGDPRQLLAGEVTVSLEDLLLVVERLDDHTDEELHEEHANEDNQDHRVENHEWVAVLLRLVVGADGVDRAPHDIDPPFGSLNRQKREHTCKGRVEVESGFDPFATVVVTVPHRLDVLIDLLRV